MVVHGNVGALMTMLFPAGQLMLTFAVASASPVELNVKSHPFIVTVDATPEVLQAV